MVMDYSEFKAFDNLNTEIIILDGDAFKLLWINDAAKAANWIGDSSKFENKSISSLLNVMLKKAEAQGKNESSNVSIDQSLQSAS